MKYKLQSITSLILLLLAGPVLAQELTVVSPAVASGTNATVELFYDAGAGVPTNLDFIMDYDDTIVDEASIDLGVLCDGPSIGLLTLGCSINTTSNEIKGIGVTLTTTPLTSSPALTPLVTITLPILAGAPAGDSIQNFARNFPPTTRPADITWTLSVLKADQTITTFTAAPDPGIYGGSSVLTGVASSLLTVGFTAGPVGVCSMNGAVTVDYDGVGTCNLTANQPGDASYNPAPTAFLDVQVNKAGQVITGLTVTPAGGDVGASSAITVASSGGSINPVVYGVVDNTICEITALTNVTYIKAGTCTVTANQDGDANHNAAAEVTVGVTVNKGDQIITPTWPASGVVDGSDALVATASSGLDVEFASTTTGTCTVDNVTDMVSYIAAGPCTLTANQPGDDDWNAAPPVTTTYTVDPADQVITNFISNPANGDPTDVVTVSATGGDSGNPVTFTSNTTGICTEGGTNGSLITLVASGTCIVEANQAGNADYNAADPDTLEIGVAKLEQTITNLAVTPDTAAIGGSSIVSATPGAAPTTMVFGTTDSNICTITTLTTVNYIAGGTCVVTANQPGDDDYNAAPEVTLDILIKFDQTIDTFVADPASGEAGGSSSLSAVASSGLTVDDFGSDTPSICTVTGSTVNYIAVGTCDLTADQPGDAEFNPADPQATLSIDVSEGSQEITNFVASPPVGVVEEESVLSATGGGSTSPVLFDTLTPEICMVDVDIVTFLDVGICIVTASQAGDNNYNAAPQVTLEILVEEKAGVYLANNDRLGDAGLFQYYTINGGWQTFIRVINTSGDAVSVKVRFREAANSREVLDFIIFLSPYDAWAGWTDDNATNRGNPGVKTTDTSCLYPQADYNNTTEGWKTLDGNLLGAEFQVRAFTDVYDDNGGNFHTPLQRVSEGHLEIIGIAAHDATSAFGRAVTHDHFTGKPFNCSEASDLFEDQAEGGEGFDLGNVLAMNGYVINVALGQGGGFDPDMLADFADYSMVADALETATDPDLDSAQSCCTKHEPREKQKGYASRYVGANNSLPVTGNVDYVSLALQRTSVVNEWAASANPGNLISDYYTQWILTFPTKHYYVDLQVDGELGDDISPTLWDPSGDSPDSNNAYAPFYEEFDWAGGQSCEPYQMRIWNREEANSEWTSPAPFYPVELCNETNVLVFNDYYEDKGLNSTFSVTIPIQLLPVDAGGTVSERGWASMDFYDHGDLSLPAGTEDKRDILGQKGLPVTGWMFSVFNTNDLATNHTTINGHKFTRHYHDEEE